MSLAAVLFVLAAAPPTSTGEPVVVYRTRRGDTLLDLGNRYLQALRDYKDVQRINHVPNPRRLPTDKPLKIPSRLLKAVPVEGRVVAFQGNVLLQNGKSGQVAALGARVGEGFTLVTGARSYVTVELPDTSRFSLPSQSRVGILCLRRIVLGDKIERRFQVDTGRSDWQVKPGTANPFSVRTPIATAAVRGTRFRITYDPARQSMTVGVVEGKVAIGGAETDAILAAGSGAALRSGGIFAPKTLLPAPQLRSPDAIQTGSELEFSANAVPGAVTYGFELARDAGFIDRFAEIRTNDPNARFDSLPGDTYFVRVTAFDGDGVEGLSNSYGFERLLNKIEAGVPVLRRAGRHRDYLFRWEGTGDGDAQYRFTLSRNLDGAKPLIDENGLSAVQISIRDMPPGIYYWHVWSTRFQHGRHSEVVTEMQKLQIGARR